LQFMLSTACLEYCPLDEKQWTEPTQSHSVSCIKSLLMYSHDIAQKEQLF
jgi:hypothetical protein